MKDTDKALTNALETLQMDDSSKKYIIFKDLQNEENDWYLVYDLIHHAIKKEEMDDKYIIASATGTESVLVI